MQFRTIACALVFGIVLRSLACAQAEPAALVDFNKNDKRSEGHVAWRAEQVKTSEGLDDLAIRADVDIPEVNLRLTMLLRRNFDSSLPASHVIEMKYEPPDFIDAGADVFLFACLAPGEMSGRGSCLLGTMLKARSDGRHLQVLSDKPDQICQNLAILIGHEWFAVYFRGGKANRNSQSLWLEKGVAGQQAFEAAFAAWKKVPEPMAAGAVCDPS